MTRTAPNRPMKGQLPPNCATLSATRSPNVICVSMSSCTSLLTRPRRRRTLRRQLHVKIVNEERPAVGLLLDDFRGWLAGAVAGLRLDPNQHRLGAALRGLQRRGVLK